MQTSQRTRYWKVGLAWALCFGTSAFAADTPGASRPLRADNAETVTVADNAIPSLYVDLQAGEWIHIDIEQVDVDVVVELRGPDAFAQDYDENANPSHEVAEIEAKGAGRYTIAVRPFEKSSKGRARVKLVERLDAAALAQRKHENAARKQAFVDWAQKSALKLHTHQAMSGFDDLKGLEAMVGDARVVMLGEPTHGSREAFQLKHRLLEYLVSVLGFNAFAIEATMPEAFALDHYVRTGEGDPEALLGSLQFWTWNTEEVRDLIAWMRRWNADPAHARKIGFYGFDMQSSPYAAWRAINALAAVDTAGAKTLRARLHPLIDPWLATAPDQVPEAQRKDAAAAVTALARTYDRSRAALVAHYGEHEAAVLRQMVRVLEQYVALAAATDSGSYELRDVAMAENLLWLLEHGAPDTRIVGWAHNGHVTTEPNSGRTQGMVLRERLGDALRVVGIYFNRGAFQAVDADAQDQRNGRRVFLVEPQADSFPSLLSAAGLSVALLDLRAVPAGPVTELLTRPISAYSIGAVFTNTPGFPASARHKPSSSFDIAAYIEATTAARPMPRSTGQSAPIIARPANLAFESEVSLRDPVDWIFPRSGETYGYRFSRTQADVHQGEWAALIARDAGPHVSHGSAELRQRIDATPWRGKTVHLHVWLKPSFTSPASVAYVWAIATGSMQGTQDAKSRVSNARKPVRDGVWQRGELKLKVPADARIVNFGVTMVGEGELRVDDWVVERAGE